MIPKSQRTEDGSSPKEKLAGILPHGVNEKGYTLTEYINDINQENVQVLAEYQADGKLRQAYTYGNVRESVDKTDGIRYYIGDGPGSVTGLVDEKGKITNSYRYDPYGLLVSGIPDAVNYYGYNAESSNTNTGLQYLRARYYSPEMGTFTTEDEERGTQENPLTRNLYAYVLNNPVNYQDPSGNAGKAKGKAVSKGSKVGASFATMANQIASSYGNKTSSKTSTKASSRSSSGKKSSGAKTSKSSKGAGTKNRKQTKKKEGTFSRFTSWASKKASKAWNKTKKFVCDTGKRISKKAEDVDWKKVGIAVLATGAAIGVGFLTGGAGLAAAGALGFAEGSFGAAVVGGAVTGAIGGAMYGATSSALSGNSLKQVGRDTLSGGLTGGLTGGVLGGLAYGAGKLFSGAKELLKGNKASKSTQLSASNNTTAKKENVKSFLDLMDDDEAARYNQYWDTAEAR